MQLAEFPERFRAKVRVTAAGCWAWQGARSPKGYGRVSGRGRNAHAHRWAWVRANGDVPDGFVLDHFRFPGACVGPACANPAHVRPVTSQENALRSDDSLAAQYASARQCVAGHALTPENVGWTAKRGRYCRTCGMAASRLERL